MISLGYHAVWGYHFFQGSYVWVRDINETLYCAVKHNNVCWGGEKRSSFTIEIWSSKRIIGYLHFVVQQQKKFSSAEGIHDTQLWSSEKLSYIRVDMHHRQDKKIALSFSSISLLEDYTAASEIYQKYYHKEKSLLL